MVEILTPAATALGVTFILSFTAYRAWRGWLDVKRLELARSTDESEGDVGVRIELADVKERLKKLEAIASGVEL
ncbi:hypothetical protein [Sphingosinicella sp. CPCC 101087]|uniref:hypothetical protein n=1 Tax=Sphingosinicella sp. CPCC 101087 TaxID=2497754 RepID=UPI00101C7478|nr:hypothetical protein [Sphingosinicella sp. CPCC 101087]